MSPYTSRESLSWAALYHLYHTTVTKNNNMWLARQPTGSQHIKEWDQSFFLIYWLIPVKEHLTLQGLGRKSTKGHTRLKQYVYPKVLKYNSIETYMPPFTSELKSASSYAHPYMSHQNWTAHTLLRLPDSVFPCYISQLALPGMPQANLWDLICPKNQTVCAAENDNVFTQ